jgi:membrane-associated phospholipid phosphatase
LRSADSPLHDRLPVTAPGRGHFGGRIGAFDHRADTWLEHVRRRRAAVVVFKGASTIGDFSIIWLVIGLVYGLGVRRDLGQTLTFVALIGAESLIVNQGIKRIFSRGRPTVSGDPRTPVRTPTTSSFPSGHASSAMFAATLLTVWTGIAWAPLWFVLAAVVATSRAVVRIHFASDVIAGLVTGLVLAQIALLIGVVGPLRC